MALFASRVLLAEEMICGVGLLAEAHAEFTHKDSRVAQRRILPFSYSYSISSYIYMEYMYNV